MIALNVIEKPIEISTKKRKLIDQITDVAKQLRTEIKRLKKQDNTLSHKIVLLSFSKENEFLYLRYLVMIIKKDFKEF